MTDPRPSMFDDHGRLRPEAFPRDRASRVAAYNAAACRDRQLFRRSLCGLAGAVIVPMVIGVVSFGNWVLVGICFAGGAVLGLTPAAKLVTAATGPVRRRRQRNSDIAQVPYEVDTQAVLDQHRAGHQTDDATRRSFVEARYRQEMNGVRRRWWSYLAALVVAVFASGPGWWWTLVNVVVACAAIGYAEHAYRQARPVVRRRAEILADLLVDPVGPA